MSMHPVHAAAFITPEALRGHWQGHRRLTRRVIEAFPEEALFGHRVAGMRPFGEMALEMLAIAAPTVRGVATGEWAEYEPPTAAGKAELLRQWDEATAQIDEWWPRIPAERFAERMTAFGRWEGPVWDLVMYAVDNEIHHRGQGYVYLRSLGIEPPQFWERE